MKVKVDKTDVQMIEEIKLQTKVAINGKTVRQSRNFNYLGSIMNANYKLEPKVNNRVASAELKPFIR